MSPEHREAPLLLSGNVNLFIQNCQHKIYCTKVRNGFSACCSRSVIPEALSDTARAIFVPHKIQSFYIFTVDIDKLML